MRSHLLERCFGRCRVVGLQLAVHQNRQCIGFWLLTCRLRRIDRLLREVPGVRVVLQIVIVDREIARDLVVQWTKRGEHLAVMNGLLIVIGGGGEKNCI